MTDTLIEKLEQAEEGSRELSDEVLLACGWRKTRWVPTGEPAWFDPQGSNGSYLPHPTRSLDDCLRYAVPEGWWPEQLSWASDGSLVIATIWNRDPGDGYKSCDGDAANPALALCIAALKARAEG